MTFIDQHLLTAIVFVPFVGALALLAFPRGQHVGARGFSLAIALTDLALCLWLWHRFDLSTSLWQFQESTEWINAYGIRYSLAVDGLTLALTVLTTFLLPLVIVSTYSAVKQYVREYMVCLLALQTGMLGAFLATDLFLFYVFWEIMLVPMYFLIGIWGGQRRVYAALKFFLYTMTGSLLMLVAILYTVLAVRDQGGLTFSLAEVQMRLHTTNLGNAEPWLFLAFAVAFAIKVPMFPFHTWLPDAHVEAPTGGSVILAGVLLKLGTFGFLRYALGLWPATAAAFLPAIGLLAVIGIVYGALVSMVQQDLKRLVAYSSVSHLGFVMLGIAAMTTLGITGSIVQMVNHGISTGALFFLVGVIYERRHTRMMDQLGGLAKVMPRYALVWVLVMLSSIGLPGLNGFVGEFLILVGTFQSQGIHIAMSTGNVARLGIFAVQAVALAAVVLTIVAVHRKGARTRLGPGTRLMASMFAFGVAAYIAAPPFGSFAGGLLIRPLLPHVGSGEPFAEVFAVLAVIGASGVILSAIYLLWATERVFFGPVTHAENQHLSDLSLRESAVIVPLVLAAIWIGLYPQPLLDTIKPTAAKIAREYREQAHLAPGPDRPSVVERAVPTQVAPWPAGVRLPDSESAVSTPPTTRFAPWHLAAPRQLLLRPVPGKATP